MSKLKLGPIDDDKPVKLTLELPSTAISLPMPGFTLLRPVFLSRSPSSA
jgi:hypothetical protein